MLVRRSGHPSMAGETRRCVFLSGDLLFRGNAMHHLELQETSATTWPRIGVGRRYCSCARFCEDLLSTVCTLRHSDSWPARIASQVAHVRVCCIYRISTADESVTVFCSGTVFLLVMKATQVMLLIHRETVAQVRFVDAVSPSRKKADNALSAWHLFDTFSRSGPFIDSGDI